jgi:hydroxypyruvate isomerase
MFTALIALDIISPMQRRNFFPVLASTALAAAQPPAASGTARKGRLKQSCFDRNFGPGMPFNDMCREGARLGAIGFDAAPLDQWPILKRFGLLPTLGRGGGITIENGIIQKQLLGEQAKSLEDFIDACAAHGCPDVLIPGGQRRGMSYAEGANNAVTFLNRVKSRAEAKGVTLCLEVMNTKYQNPALGRKDQVCNRLSWAAEVCTRVSSPRVKILFDIYHVQITDGDVVANIRTYFPLIGHFHTGGVPGRHELDDTQELNYGFILRTIADLGYAGYVAHEYDPTPGRDPIRSLEKVFAITDV